MKKIVIFTLLFAPVLSLAQKKQNTSTQNGRFQLIQLSDFRRDQYLLDTQTGKIWVGTCGASAKNGDCVYNLWAPQDVVGITLSENDYSLKLERIEKILKAQDAKQ